MSSLRDGAGQRKYKSVYFVFFVTSTVLALLSYYHKKKRIEKRKEVTASWGHLLMIS